MRGFAITALGSIIATLLWAQDTRTPASLDRPVARPAQIATRAAPAKATIKTNDELGVREWRIALYRRALSEGIDPRTFAAVLNNNGKAKNADLPPSPFDRVLTGRWMHLQHAELIDQISKRYQVDKSILLGIWGIESRFGRYMGDDPLGTAMTKYVMKGKRDFAENQLLSAMLLVQGGEVEASALVGSYAGAMGHTQFIPTSYMAYAVDGDNNGTRDLWTIADALASTANYLHEHGWKFGESWGTQVILPPNFKGSIGREIIRTGYYWNLLGVRLADGRKLAHDTRAPIIQVRGKFYLAYHNFSVIRRYNHSDEYVVDVASLGERIAIRTGAKRVAIATPIDLEPTNITAASYAPDIDEDRQEPRQLRTRPIAIAARQVAAPTVPRASDDGAAAVAEPATENIDTQRAYVTDLQNKLKAARFYQGPIDGQMGAETERAVGHFQRVNKLRITGQVDAPTARALGL